MIKGQNEEIAFWKTFVKSDRLNHWVSNERNPELQEDVYTFITDMIHERKGLVDVLDCGSGVCSILQGTVSNAHLKVTDVLADEYAKLIEIFNSKISSRQLASRYNVSKTTIDGIKSKKYWKSITCQA